MTIGVFKGLDSLQGKKGDQLKFCSGILFPKEVSKTPGQCDVMCDVACYHRYYCSKSAPLTFITCLVMKSHIIQKRKKSVKAPFQVNVCSAARVGEQK